MHYALFYLFGVVAVGCFGRGQAHTVNQSSKEAGKVCAVRGTGTVRYWFNNTRPFGAPQSHVGVVRWDKVQWR